MGYKSMRRSLVVFAIQFLVANATFTHCAASGVSDEGKKAASETNAPTVYHADDPKSWARVKRIEAVNFPQVSLKQGQTGRVDAEVLIDILGNAKVVRALTSTPKNAEFEEAALAALKTANFAVVRSERCVPVESVGELQFEFVIIDGVGRVHLTHREATKTSHNALQAPPLSNREEATAAIKASYPVEARRAGAQASVSMLLDVNPQTGAVISAHATNVVSMKGMERYWGKVATDAIKSARFEAIAGQTDPVKICFAIDYRLVGVERYKGR